VVGAALEKGEKEHRKDGFMKRKTGKVRVKVKVT